MLDLNTIPQHIAIIMDGNGRWAKKRKLPRIAGHSKGAQRAKDIIKACSNLGVKYLTLYAFSTENWKRPKIEIKFLMSLFLRYLKKEAVSLDKNNVRFLTIGRVDKFPENVQQLIREITEQTKQNTGLTLILALNYGARLEIVDAALKLAEDINLGVISRDKINEEIFSTYLYTAEIPDPDILIRTSGEMRISNFLLWQISYTELYVTAKLWPEFNQQELELAINDFQHRSRRFGNIEAGKIK
ncbi:MAG: isoprenyl transferase [Candidatus Omnitrophota bacterium]|nr:MAG: isoprenyl transferase [Candidatus Omnitrophota bacterium]